MYAYVATREAQQRDFYEGATWDPELKESVNPDVTQPREIAYWRKHPNLHGWMHRLWESKGNSGTFNGKKSTVSWLFQNQIPDYNKLTQGVRL